MRTLALLIGLASGLVSGCSLYFDKDGHDRPVPLPYPVDAGIRVDAPYPPPPIDAGFPGSGEMMARCENGIVRVVPAPLFVERQPHGFGDFIGACPSATCGSAAIICRDRACFEAASLLCNAPISSGATCSLHGSSCEGTELLDCPEVTSCSEPVLGSSCACVDGAYQCEQLTPAAAVQARIVGKWTGLVTPPNFALPYRISLWIYPDGSYWPESLEPTTSASAFYYGGDGPSPMRKIKILSTSDDRGSWADIAIDFGTGTNTGLLSALVVDASSLRFTFSPTWLDSCGKPFDFELTRARETR